MDLGLPTTKAKKKEEMKKGDIIIQITKLLLLSENRNIFQCTKFPGSVRVTHGAPELEGRRSSVDTRFMAVMSPV